MNEPNATAPALYRCPLWAEAFWSVIAAAESTRHGGVSPPPYHSLNLGLYTHDHPYHLAENRRRFCQALGFAPEQLAGGRQVHGHEVLTVDSDGQWEGYDAFVCALPGIFVSVSVADCAPILLFDPEARVVGAAHAGWRGTVAGIGPKTVAAMSALGARPERCFAYIGTCIDACDFEVSADVAEQFAEAHCRPGAAPGKFLVDLKAANRDQLFAAGLSAGHIDISPFSTVAHQSDYFSHRASGGITGRAMAVIGLR